MSSEINQNYSLHVTEVVLMTTHFLNVFLSSFYRRSFCVTVEEQIKASWHLIRFDYRENSWEQIPAPSLYTNVTSCADNLFVYNQSSSVIQRNASIRKNQRKGRVTLTES